MMAERPEVLVLTAATPWLADDLRRDFTVHELRPGADRDALVAAVGARVRAIVTLSKTPVDRALIAALPALELICNAGGHAHMMDVAAARERGIGISVTPDISNDDVADLAIALLLAAARQVPAADRHARSGAWAGGPLPLAIRVSGKRLGILGLGDIGRAVARRAEGFALEVAYTGPRPKSDMPFRYHADLTAMAREVDFLVATCAVSAATRGLVDRPVLDALGPRGVVVDVTLDTVDVDAAAAALEAGTLGAAAFDVYATEPQIPARLLAAPRAVLTSHIGSATGETRDAMARLAIANLRAHFAGRPLPTPLGAAEAGAPVRP